MHNRNLQDNFFDCVTFDDNETWKSELWRNTCNQTEQKNCANYADKTECEKFGDICIWTNEKCTRNSFIIAFEANGGNCSDCSDVTKKYGETVTLPDPKKKGNTFGGWFKEKIFKNEWTKGTTVTGDQTLYAKWTAINYTITFMNESTTYKTKTLEYNTTIDLPEGPNKIGHTFDEWEPEESLEQRDGKYVVPDHDVIFDARWTINNYTITFMNESTTYKTKTLEYNTTIALPEGPNKIGHTFDEWEPEESLEQRDGKYVVPDHDVIFDAQWTINNYTITLITKCNTTFDDIVLEYNETITDLPDGNNMTKTGYTFECWTLDGVCLSTTATMPAKNITLTAKWNQNSHSKKLSSVAIASIATSAAVVVIIIIIVIVLVLVKKRRKASERIGRPLLIEESASIN